MKCKFCKNKAVIEPGWVNISRLMYPLCEEHMKEYQEFKKGYGL